MDEKKIGLSLFITKKKKETENKMSSEQKYEYAEKEFCIFNEKNQKIYGIQYIPKVSGKSKFPFVILSHGLNATHKVTQPYAKGLAEHGIAAYIYDFRGGSVNSKSDLTTYDMSIDTEVDDIITVFNTAKTWSFVDTDHIFLMGESQGGLTSIIAGTKIENEIQGLILLYPAYVAHYDATRLYKSIDDIPEKLNYLGFLPVSKQYVVSVYNLDIYEMMKHFNKPVIIIHGVKDHIVNISYGERAEKTFPNAKLYKLPEEDHGFQPPGILEALNITYNFLREQKVLQ